jgi:hypothetical protein
VSFCSSKNPAWALEGEKENKKMEDFDSNPEIILKQVIQWQKGCITNCGYFINRYSSVYFSA